MVDYPGRACLGTSVCVETPAIPLPFLDCFGNVFVVTNFDAIPFLQLNFTSCTASKKTRSELFGFSEDSDIFLVLDKQ
jgi:hypothetical protein